MIFIQILQISVRLTPDPAGWSFIKVESSLILSPVLRILGWQVEQFFPSQWVELAMDEQRDRLYIVTDADSLKLHQMVLPQDAYDLLKADILLL